MTIGSVSKYLIVKLLTQCLKIKEIIFSSLINNNIIPCNCRDAEMPNPITLVCEKYTSNLGCQKILLLPAEDKIRKS